MAEMELISQIRNPQSEDFLSSRKWKFRISNFEFRICQEKGNSRHGMLLGGRLLSSGHVE